MRKEADPLLSDVRVKHLIAQSVPHYHIQCRVCWTLANLLSLTWYHSSRCIIHYHNYIATCAIHTATATPANFRHFFFFTTRLFANIFFTHSLAAAADVSAKSSDISPRSNSSMSRRKQAKPQHLKSDEEDPALGGVLSENGECCFLSTTNS